MVVMMVMVILVVIVFNTLKGLVQDNQVGVCGCVWGGGGQHPQEAGKREISGCVCVCMCVCVWRGGSISSRG